MATNLHEDGITLGNAREHVSSNMLNARKSGGIVNHVRQIEVNALHRGVLGDDHAEDGSRASTDVDHGVESLEALVSLEDLLHREGGVLGHASVEHLVEPGVRAVVLERGHSVRLVERDPAVEDCILQVIPGTFISIVINTIKQLQKHVRMNHILIGLQVIGL